MNLFTLLHILEPITTAAARLYVVAGEVFTIAVILHGLKLLAGLIEGTYKAAIHTYTAGKLVGEYYRAYIHDYLKEAVLAVIAVTVILMQFAALGAQVVWRDRMDYLRTVNQWRDNIGSAFSYHSPTTIALY